MVELIQRKTELSRGAQFVPAQGLESNPGHKFLSTSQARHRPVPYMPLSDETQSLQLTLSKAAIAHPGEW